MDKIGVTIIVIIVVVMSLSLGMLQLNRDATPPDKDIHVTFTTIAVTSTTWEGTINISASGQVLEILIPTETQEIAAHINNSAVSTGINPVTVNFPALSSGTYPLIFRFLVDSIEFSRDMMMTIPSV